MALTNPKDFKTFLELIPKNVLENMWFFPVRQDNKNPDVPGGTILKGNVNYRLSRYDALNRLKWGKNVGIYALPGGLMFLDLDVDKGNFLASPELIRHISDIPTISVQSRNGGLQKYFLNNGKYANQLIKENEIIIGELRTNWQYVVSIGSYVPPDEHNNRGDGTYRMKQEYASMIEFQKIPGLDKLTLFGEITPKPTKAEKSIWNNDTVKAEKISNESYAELMKGRIRTGY